MRLKGRVFRMAGNRRVARAGGMPLPGEAEGEREGVLEGVANYAAPLTFILSSSRGRGEKDRIKRPRRFDLTRLRS